MTRKNVQFNINPLLSGPSLQARTLSGSPYRELNISDIDIDPDQPRRVFDEEALQELANSIKEHGVLCPILVKVTAGGSYRVVAGERRYRASKLIGKTTIPAIIEGEESGDILSKQLVENLQRQDLNPLERAFAIGRLRDNEKLSIRDIAARLGVSKGLVQRSLEILALPEDLQAALAEGAPETKIFVLSQVEDPVARRGLLERIDELTREQLEAEIQSNTAEKVYHGGTAPSGKRARKNELSTDDRRVMEELQRSLGTRIQIVRKKGKPERGRLVIEFYSSDDFNELVSRLQAERG